MMLERLEAMNRKPKANPAGSILKVLATILFFASVYYIVLARI